MRTAILILVILAGGCAAPRKACQVERICYAYRQDMTNAIAAYPAMMTDILKTIATLENETGHYR